VLVSNSIIEPGDKVFETDDAPKRGRPRGISEYPELHRLIFFLAKCMARHGALLTAHMKTNEQTRVAAGSLIDTLNILRRYLAQQPDWKWLTEFLPLPDQHERHVATYRRLLGAAMKAARSEMLQDDRAE
jgi:hypothetical protein